MTKGINFPLSVVSGNLAVTSEGDLFKGHILSWLQTEPRQRVMRPAYGMKDYLFETISDISLITSNIKEGLQDYIPQVNFEVQGSLSDTGEVEVYVYWSYEGDESTLKVTL
ncbi:hypothetical protein H6G76_35115 [Nostoc sp. FACHB-152]|uniref:hypothetical protein n=1 Tax=Nostoc sp. FACHB-152 TaxID=2692837 RepID=UPI0016824F04|nr:hypothetical protein [Nostoc sp. FACHB-152]MBD2452242.1 hypothetical protein [Nostoc sp. FACHB-152]